MDSLVVTADIVPTFPVKANSLMNLFDNVTRTLVDRRPKNWVKYVRSLALQDRILPDEFLAHMEGEGGKIFDVGMKILHYGQTDNCMTRPGQRMQISDFHDRPILKEVYCYAKALKTFIGIDVKSFFLKESSAKLGLSDKSCRKLRGFRRIASVGSIIPRIGTSF